MKVKRLDYIIRISFIFPLMFLMGVFIVYPFLSSLFYSMTDWTGFGGFNFIGLENYKNLFSDTAFRHALLKTLFFTLVSMLIANPIALLLALLLNTAIKGRDLLRTIFYLPTVLSALVVSYVWTIIMTYDGVFNKLLSMVGLGKYAIDWLGNMDFAPWTLIVVLLWQGLGTAIVFYLAGLNTIPLELYESAYIDGVGKWSKFRYITFPLLMPTITVVTFFSLAGTLKMFDLPFIMTNGGPGDATVTLGMLVYTQAFKNYTFGYATTTGIVMFLLIITVSIIQLRLTRSREVEM